MWKFYIDTGGTFTDCLAIDSDGEAHRVKVLSSSAVRGRCVGQIDSRSLELDIPRNIKDGFFKGYRLQVHGVDFNPISIEDWTSERRIASLASELPAECEGKLCSLLSPEEPPLLAARIVTGKGLDETLPAMEMRLATTRGTNALLEETGAPVGFFVTKGFRDLLRIGNQQRPDLFEIGIRKPPPLHSLVFEVDERLSASGDIELPVDASEIRRFAKDCQEAGIEAVAIAFLHSYLNDTHEREVARILREEGVRRISLSSALSPAIKILPRAETAVVNAYLSPIMDSYLDRIQGALPDRSLKVMTSAGGLVSRASYRSKDSLLSGPAGGVVGAAAVGERAGYSETIAFDMGGTSTDVSRYKGGLEYKYLQTIGSATVMAPALRIETVAAGGGSICWFDGSALRVGPQSAGADPGPACYGAGGPLTITDVNLLLGRMDASRFGIPVFREKAQSRLEELVAELQEGTNEAVDAETILLGLLDIANERMAEAIRGISLREGYAPSEYALTAFGGAGGMHACSIADILDMDTILFPEDAGLLSAFGLRQARLERIARRQILETLDECREKIPAWIEELKGDCSQKLIDDLSHPESIATRFVQADLRYLGQEASLMVDVVDGQELSEAFESHFKAQYGFNPELPIELVGLVVAVSLESQPMEGEAFPSTGERLEQDGESSFGREALSVGQLIAGPRVIQDPFSTIYIDEGWEGVVGSGGSLRLTRAADFQSPSTTHLSSVALELYTNRFLSLVKEMGSLLERAAFSTNVKERRDFSCALLDRDGFLIANAPHIPVHLGALGVCVRSVLKRIEVGEGDVIVTNHPGFGGSHLPDVTLLAGVYTDEGELIGYVANRAHHAEMGGIAPGSMPPNATSLEEEGVVIEPMHIARRGVVDWNGVTQALGNSRYPTRRLDENLADLAAQLASIRFGSEQLRKLCRMGGADTIAFYMNGLKQRARDALSRSLAALPFRSCSHSESLDDGALIAVEVLKRASLWTIDFSGSAVQQASNYNATPAIATSAVLYVLRLLANESVPLNEGILDLVDLRIPNGILNPIFDDDAENCPPVVAGNVEVSQRIVDTLIKAFGIAACSQGTMNNLIFGNDRVSYYETIGGGEGASEKLAGASGVHTHMTNTGITDPEVFETRYPAKIDRFQIRENSGGVGLHRGGNGLIRCIRFLDSVVVSILTQHRKVAPYGQQGGNCGACGEQFKIDRSGKRSPLPGNGSIPFEAGESIEIRTPGGGGWGAPSVSDR